MEVSFSEKLFAYQLALWKLLTIIMKIANIFPAHKIIGFCRFLGEIFDSPTASAMEGVIWPRTVKVGGELTGKQV